MKFICENCGCVFDEEHIVNYDEGHGFDHPPYQKLEGCPRCLSGFEEAIKCEICGKYVSVDDASGCVCGDCLEKYENDIDACYKVGANYKESVELNCLLISLFTEKEIEVILLEHAKAKNLDLSLFVDGDREWFAEKLAKGVNNNEICKK